MGIQLPLIKPELEICEKQCYSSHYISVWENIYLKNVIYANM